MTDPEEAASMLGSPPGWTSANDLDEALRKMHLPGQALAEWWRAWAAKLDEATGLTPELGEVLREAAGQLDAIADRVEERCGPGIMKRGSSSPAPSFPEAVASLPPIPAKYRDEDPRKYVLAKWLADRDPDRVRSGRARRTG